MLYPIILFILVGFAGTLLALRLQAIDAQEHRSILTRRGRVVVAIALGIAVGIIVVALNGMWWNCDSGTCSFTWGY